MARGKGNENTTRIVLVDGYEILCDSLNYTLVYNTGKTEENGRIVYRYLSYHGKMEDAIIAAKKECARRSIMSSDTGDVMTLTDAVSIIVRSNNKFEVLVKNAFEGVTV